MNMLNFFKIASLANITTTNPIYSQSVIIFTIIDIIATFLVGMTTLLAPNISVQVFKKEPTMVILFIILMLMIILSFRPLRIRPTYPTPRKVYPDTDYLRKINKTGQQYVDKYETDIQANINKNRKFYRPKASKNIGGINEE